MILKIIHVVFSIKIIQIEDFNLDNILIDEKSNENILVYNISYKLLTDSQPFNISYKRFTDSQRIRFD